MGPQTEAILRLNEMLYMLTVLCVAEKLNKRMSVSSQEHQSALDLQESLQRLPLNHTDPMIKHICSQILCKRLMNKVSLLVNLNNAD